jgi:hypothetical protein
VVGLAYGHGRSIELTWTANRVIIGFMVNV